VRQLPRRVHAWTCALRYSGCGPAGTTATGQSASAREWRHRCTVPGLPRLRAGAAPAKGGGGDGRRASDARAPHFVERVAGAHGERAPASEHGGKAGEALGAVAGGAAGGGEGERRGEGAALTSLPA
jgi:hypothetical protein